MPKNKVMYYGVLVLVASALMWLAAEVLQRYVMQFLPYSAGVGILLIVVGVVMEAKKNKADESTAGSNMGPSDSA